MKKYFYYLFLSAFLLAGCDLDNNLFNAEKLTSYKLPGNTIPDSLISRVSFKSGRNTLYGFLVTGENNGATKTILYFHGNKHNIDEYWDRVMYLHGLGVNVFVFDYLGFGMSEGESSEASLYEDGLAALNYLRSLKNMWTQDVTYYGYSLGNVVSIHLAAEVASPARLVAESPFASAASLTQGSLVLDIPAGWLTSGKFDNLAEIPKIKCPFMLLHGSDDDFVRFRDNGQLIFNAAPNPKYLVLVQGANHINVPETLTIPAYQDTLRFFLGSK
jgi:hypothetical protein